MRLLLFLFLLSPFYGFAQCVPEASTNNQGIYPSTLATGCLNTAYDDTLTIVFPVDTFVSGFIVPFDSFKVDMVNNLPLGLNSECNLSDCKAYPPSPGMPARACIRVFGTPTSVPAIDSVDLSITAWVTLIGTPQGVSGIIQKVKLPMHEVTIDNIVENDPLCSGQFNGTIEVTASSTGTIIGYSYDNGTFFSTDSVLGPLGAGTYDVVVQDGAGCTASTTAELVSPDQISIDNFNQQTPSCAGFSDASLDLEVSGGTGSYEYSLDGITYQSSPVFTGLSAGSIPIYVRDENNCIRNVSFNMFDGFLVDTSVTVTTNSISANAGGLYQWLSCNDQLVVPGETGATFTPAVTGTYAAIIAAGGCTDTSACYPVQGLTVGLNELDALNAIHTYPNPTLGDVTIELGAPYALVQCEVRNAIGQLVQSVSTTDTQVLNVYLDGKPGLYLLEVTLDGMLSRTLRIRKE